MPRNCYRAPGVVFGGLPHRFGDRHIAVGQSRASRTRRIRSSARGLASYALQDAAKRIMGEPTELTLAAAAVAAGEVPHQRSICPIRGVRLHSMASPRGTVARILLLPQGPAMPPRLWSLGTAPTLEADADGRKAAGTRTRWPDSQWSSWRTGRIGAVDWPERALTTCAIGVAETGTIVRNHSAGQGAGALTMVPDYHLVDVRSDQIVAGIPDAVARLHLIRPQTWISGPSATSDIELDRVEGVHGPRQLEILIVAP